MRFGEFPIEIRTRILEINPHVVATTRLNDAFHWGTTDRDGEGNAFWRAIDDGVYTGFYQKYPKGSNRLTNTECVVTTQNNTLIVHSFVSPEPAKMVLNRKEALMLMEKLQAFIDATEEKSKPVKLKKDGRTIDAESTLSDL